MVDDKAAANCELIYRLYSQAEVTPNLNEATALFVGIAFDTRHFALANSPTFEVVAKLVAVGIDAQATLAQYALPIEPSRITSYNVCYTKLLRNFSPIRSAN